MEALQWAKKRSLAADRRGKPVLATHVHEPGLRAIHKLQCTIGIPPIGGTLAGGLM